VEGTAIAAAVVGTGMFIEQTWFLDSLVETRPWLHLMRGAVFALLVAALAVLLIHKRLREREVKREQQRREAEFHREEQQAAAALRARAERDRAANEAALKRERTAAEEVLRASEERFRALVEKCSDALALLAEDGTFLYVNPSTSRITGYSSEELLGGTTFHLIHPDDLTYAKCLFTECLQKPGIDLTAEYRCRHKNGTWRDMESSAVNRLQDPSIKGIVVTYRDITDRKQGEESLHENRELHRIVVETAGDALLAIDEHSTILFANPAAEKLFGYTAGELASQPLTMLMAESTRQVHRAGLTRYCATGLKHFPWKGVRMSGLHKSGKEVLLEMSFGEYCKDGRRVFVGMARDVSDLQRAKEFLQKDGDPQDLTPLENLYLPVGYAKSVTANT
jgi:PAS domain S-box-containing protein